MSADVGFALAALACVLIAEPLSRYARLPSAVLLVVVGLVYGELPGPNVTLEPELVLTLILPPLLYSTALRASLVDIRSNLRAIGSLSVGLTLATAFAVGALLHAVVPSVPFALAVALGAAVAPPDPVASLAIGRRAGLPTRLMTLVEGEGLLNDATALTTYKVAVAAAVGGGFSPWHAAGSFVLEALGGLAIGLVVSVIVRLFRRVIRDPLIENGVSLGVPFGCYIAADAAHSSGVLAVVVAGLVLGHARGGAASGPARLQTRSVWRLLDFLLEGFVFLLIGQQLPTVLDGLDRYSTGTLTGAAAVTLGAVLIVRPVWLLAAHGWSAGRGSPTGSLRLKEVAALSWAGTRGVISLAAVFGLPLTVHGAPLPGRDLLLFCAYVVVLVTLVGQGLTFAPLLSRLGLPSGAAEERQVRAEARLAAARAGAARLDEICAEDDIPNDLANRVRAAARAQTERRERMLNDLLDVDDDATVSYAAEVSRLRRMQIEAQREELVRWRDGGRLSDRSLRELDKELDIEESRPTL